MRGCVMHGGHTEVGRRGMGREARAAAAAEGGE